MKRSLALLLITVFASGSVLADRKPAAKPRPVEDLLDDDDRREEVGGDPEVLAMVRNIIAYSGLEMNFTLVARRGLENAFATISDGRRILVYDPDYLKAIAEAGETDWARLGVLAHEIGHHLQGHTLEGKGSNPTDELAADRYAGFVMGLMGATLEQAQAHQALMSEEGSDTHPGKSVRLEATRQGWDRACKLSGKRSGTSSHGCPIVRLDKPVEREISFGLALAGEFVVPKLTIRWGYDGTVCGSFEMKGAARRLIGHTNDDGSLTLDHYSGCITLGVFRLKPAPDAKPFETWTGTYDRSDEDPVEAVLIAPKRSTEWKPTGTTVPAPASAQ